MPTPRIWYGTAPKSIDREQAARLAAILPLPLKRRPERMNRSSGLILKRMRQMGWSSSAFAKSAPLPPTSRSSRQQQWARILAAGVENVAL